MKSRIIILGCGSSVGVPRIDGYWGNCDKKNVKNRRLRCSAAIIKGTNCILIDTSPDLREQLLNNNIKNVNSVIFTHEHADQTNGLFELRPFFWRSQKRINVYGNTFTINRIRRCHDYLFTKSNLYPAIVKSNVIKSNFTLGKGVEKISFKAIQLKHGLTNSLAYIFDKIAYISDCSDLSIIKRKEFFNLKYLIIDCLKFKKHPSHFNLEEVLYIQSRLNPKKTILTNLHYDLDYNYLIKHLPKNIVPAHDGLSLNF